MSTTKAANSPPRVSGDRGAENAERKKKPPNLNRAEAKVLSFLAENFNCDGWYFGFRPIMRATKLTRREVRLACRSLKRKGLTDFCAGLWSEDGEPGGSGYSATNIGVELMECSA